MSNTKRITLIENKFFLSCFLAILLFSINVNVANADNGKHQLYTGKIGLHAIVMELNFKPSNIVEGRYFYKKYHQDIFLQGVRIAENIILHERSQSLVAKQIIIKLNTDNQISWKGTWLRPRSKPVAITLSPSILPPPDKQVNAYIKSLYDTSPYDYLRLYHQKLVKKNKQKFMGYTLQWYVEPTSNLMSFDVIAGYSAAQLKNINDQLRNQLWYQVNNYYHCLPYRNNNSHDFYQAVIPHYLSADALSLSFLMGYDCGELSPDFVNLTLTIDPSTAKILTLDDVLQRHWQKRNGNTLLPVNENHKNKKFITWLLTQFNQLYPDKMNNTNCNYQASNVWQYASWYLTEKGIFFVPIFPKMKRICEVTNWSLLPYKKLDDYLM